MNTHHFLKTRIEIENWLNRFNITNYIIHPDLVVDVNDKVDLSYKNLSKIPLQFGKIKGIFDISDNLLTSFIGFPQEVRAIIASRNSFINTDYITPIVHGNIILYECNTLEELTNFPTFLKGRMVIDVDQVHDNFKINCADYYSLRDIDNILKIDSQIIDKIKVKRELEAKLFLSKNIIKNKNNKI